jgi:type IV secretion system protein VirB3
MVFLFVKLIDFLMSGSVSTDSLFLGLTRPPMLFGVSYVFAVLNIMISLITFVLSNNFKVLLVVMPTIHMVAYFICLKEPRAIELFIAKNSKCNICKNRFYYKGTNSYDPF